MSRRELLSGLGQLFAPKLRDADIKAPEVKGGHRMLLRNTVGMIHSLIDIGGEVHTLEGTGFIIRSPYDGLSYVVTARHVVFPFFRKQGESADAQTTSSSERMFRLHSNPPRDIRLGNAYFPWGVDYDIAVLEIYPDDQKLIGEQALKVLTNKQVSKLYGDEKTFYAGFPDKSGGDLKIFILQKIGIMKMYQNLLALVVHQYFIL